MFWPALTLGALVALVALHFWWRGRLARAQEASRRQVAEMRREQESDMSQVRTQQETLFNSMIEGLLLLDEDGRIELANRAFSGLFGIGADAHGKTIMEAIRNHEVSELATLVGVDQQVLGREIRINRPVERAIEVNAAAILDGGMRRGTLLVFHDLTPLKQLETVRTEFVANVSHELRTPLSLIKGYVETLLAGAKDDPAVATKFLETIDRNAERLRLLIEDLLTISELESGRLKLNLQTVVLPPLIEKVFGDFRSRARSKGVKLVSRTPSITVRADAGRVEQVLGNLIDNAIKYGRAEGTVVVSAESFEDQMIKVCVKDDGPGIPKGALDRVFERFFRVDKARSREQGGTGLGLSIVKHIVHSHGGKVWAASEPGEGAALYFTLAEANGEIAAR